MNTVYIKSSSTFVVQYLIITPFIYFYFLTSSIKKELKVNKTRDIQSFTKQF